MLAELTKARDLAQDELAAAEIALLEATAAAEALRETARRLEAAVAALTGDPVAEPAAQDAGHSLLSSEAKASSSLLTPEEFDKERKRRQRQKEKEALAANPLAHIKCGGCGIQGHVQEQYIQAPSGVTLSMLVCGKCNNQMMK